MSDPSVLNEARAALASAERVLVTAGAGIGVDSGLPDFRGVHGFWRAHPAAKRLGLQFEDLANPRWFERDPTLAWGFYGQRANLYRQTVPHEGYEILTGWVEDDGFVYTSNVDGQFQRAGVAEERVVEIHGSIRHLQCSTPCSDAIWPEAPVVTVDQDTLRAAEPLPTCPRCGAISRPNRD